MLPPPLSLFPQLALFLICTVLPPFSLNPFSSLSYSPLSRALGWYVTYLYHFPPLPLFISATAAALSYIFIAHIAAICSISRDQSGSTKFSRFPPSLRGSIESQPLSLSSSNHPTSFPLCLAIWLRYLPVNLHFRAPVRGDPFFFFGYFFAGSVFSQSAE